MRSSIWPRVIAAVFVLGAPVVAQAQEAGVYFSVAPRAESPVPGANHEPANYSPIGFLIVATYYFGDNWYGPTAEIGYSGGALESRYVTFEDRRPVIRDFEGGVSTITGLVGLRFRLPGSKNWRFHPSVHFMGGVAKYRLEDDVVGFYPTNFAFSTGFALHYDLAAGKAIGAQWDAIGTDPASLLQWRLALGAVFDF